MNMTLYFPKKINVIVDLDGTLALDDHRRKLIIDKDINAYFDACVDDELNIPVAHYMAMVAEFGFKIHIITGRSQRVRDLTLDWLRKHDICFDTLSMRHPSTYNGTASSGAGFGKDEDTKLAMLEALGLTSDNTLVCLDDRPDMVDWYRGMGFDCWAVRPLGKFY